MFESLKRIAMQKLSEKMSSNSLGGEETSAAAEEGAGAIMDSIQSKLAGGNIGDVLAMFKGENLENNGIFNEAKSKLASILESKGMSTEEAAGEAERTAPDLVASLKAKFDSNEESDSEFNLESLASLVPGDLMNKAQGLLGGNAGDLLNKAKNLF